MVLILPGVRHKSNHRIWANVDRLTREVDGVLQREEDGRLWKEANEDGMPDELLWTVRELATSLPAVRGLVFIVLLLGGG